MWNVIDTYQIGMNLSRDCIHEIIQSSFYVHRDINGKILYINMKFTEVNLQTLRTDRIDGKKPTEKRQP